MDLFLVVDVDYEPTRSSLVPKPPTFPDVGDMVDEDSKGEYEDRRAEEYEDRQQAEEDRKRRKLRSGSSIPLNISDSYICVNLHEEHRIEETEAVRYETHF